MCQIEKRLKVQRQCLVLISESMENTACFTFCISQWQHMFLDAKQMITENMYNQNGSLTFQVSFDIIALTFKVASNQTFTYGCKMGNHKEESFIRSIWYFYQIDVWANRLTWQGVQTWIGFAAVFVPASHFYFMFCVPFQPRQTIWHCHHGTKKKISLGDHVFIFCILLYLLYAISSSDVPSFKSSKHFPIILQIATSLQRISSVSLYIQKCQRDRRNNKAM